MDARIERYRKRALALVKENLNSSQVDRLDYAIDDCLREVFKLPKRPKGDLPYVGWMMGKGKDDSRGMRTSQSGIDLIKSHEGLRTKAYMCPANVLTIGYGHTSKVYPGQVISHQEAERLLKEDLRRFEDAVNKYVKVPLSQNQFDALVSFAFNVGVTAFGSSTLLRFLNDGNYREAANQFGRWVNGGGIQLPGLVRRREEERELFLR